MHLSSISGQPPLGRLLNSLRPQIAIAAQQIYDDWEQDEFDEGGICDQISMAISGILTSADIDCTEGGHDGDDHSYIIAYNESAAYLVDIPYDIYEIGGGYSWTKIPNVVFDESDIVIEPTHRPDWV